MFMWNRSSRDRKISNNNAPRRPGLAPLSRFDPVHKREELKKPQPDIDTVKSAPSPHGLKTDIPPSAAPLTPLNQLIYDDAETQAKASKATATVAEPAAAPAAAETPPAKASDMTASAGYLTGLEEEPPITVNILRRALPQRFEAEPGTE